MSRIQRLTDLLASRCFDYRGLQAAHSIEEATAWFRQRPTRMFNGNGLRAKVVQGIIGTNRCSCFIETGTYHAATAIGVNRFLRLPVFSCEVYPSNYRISRLVTIGMSGISLTKSDSRDFLSKSVSNLRTVSNARPFFYLDAHENVADPTSLPLKEEINYILQLRDLAVMIDDIRVPGNDDFQGGVYDDVAVEIALVRDVLLKEGIGLCYFPAYLPVQDSGYPSGYCVFWRSAVLDAVVMTKAFPFDLIRAFSLKDTRYVGS